MQFQLTSLHGQGRKLREINLEKAVQDFVNFCVFFLVFL